MLIIKEDHCSYTYVLLLVDDNTGVDIGGVGLNVYTSDIKITGLEIEPDFQRKGWAMVLLEAIKKIAWDVPVRLNVEKDNLPAIRLYEKAGFKRTGETKWHEYVMVWTP